LWRLGEPPILLMVVSVQLSQVVMPLIYANLKGVPLAGLSYVGDLNSAMWFALAAMLSLVIGMWCGQLNRGAEVISELRAEAKAWAPRDALLFCVTTLVVGALSSALGGLSQGLTQPALAASRVQWLGIFVLTCVCVGQRRGYQYLLLVSTLEVIQGI